MMLKCLLLIIVFFCFGVLNAQDKGEIIQQRIEFISEQLQSENLDLTNIIEQLNFYFDNPINLNATQGQELEELILLTEVQINDLILHRKAFGNFISIFLFELIDKFVDSEGLITYCCSKSLSCCSFSVNCFFN